MEGAAAGHLFSRGRLGPGRRVKGYLPFGRCARVESGTIEGVSEACATSSARAGAAARASPRRRRCRSRRRGGSSRRRRRSGRHSGSPTSASPTGLGRARVQEGARASRRSTSTGDNGGLGGSSASSAAKRSAGARRARRTCLAPGSQGAPHREPDEPRRRAPGSARIGAPRAAASASSSSKLAERSSSRRHCWLHDGRRRAAR